MKNAQTQAWADDLRTTTAPQTRSHLAGPVFVGDDEVTGYCCLGRGCVVAGIEGTPDVDANGHVIISYAGARLLPPKEFARWLGHGDPAVVDGEVSVDIDWPAGLDDQCSAHDGCAGDETDDCYATDYAEDENIYSCAQLNDDLQLTFPQIGDLVAYFGVAF